MTQLLASINSLEEAEIVLNVGVDIIDLKQPSQGALGALSIEDVKQIVEFVAKRKPVSATVGDLPMLPDLVFDAVQNMAATGVDFVKIGVFPDGDSLASIKRLAALNHYRLIAVLFADALPDFCIITVLKDAGFTGVMIDTMDKSRGSLLSVIDEVRLTEFVQLCKTKGLLCGLAGSLRLSDIATLLPYSVDYLGFRGALCVAHQRTARLDKNAILTIKQAMLCNSYALQD